MLIPAVADGVLQPMSPRAADFGKRARRRHFARGLNTIGKEFVYRVLDRSRELVDDCTGLTQRLRQWDHRDPEARDVAASPLLIAVASSRDVQNRSFFSCASNS